MKLKAQKPPSIKRTSRALKPKVEIVIACEGANTEPWYFEECVAEYGAGLVRLRVLNETGVPVTVVTAAIEEREKLLTKCRRSPNSFDACFRVCAVFDRDEHPRFEEAIALAAKYKIDVAYSNPCFELWPLLHIENYGGQDGRHGIQRRLRKAMPKYDHENGARIDFPLIKNQFHEAYERAKAHGSARVAEGDPFGCPSTSVSELVLKIVQNGKGGFSRS